VGKQLVGSARLPVSGLVRLATRAPMITCTTVGGKFAAVIDDTDRSTRAPHVG